MKEQTFLASDEDGAKTAETNLEELQKQLIELEKRLRKIEAADMRKKRLERLGLRESRRKG